MVKLKEEISTYLDSLDLADKLLLRDTYYLFCGGNESREEKAITKILNERRKKMYNLNPKMVEMICISKDNISYKFKCKVCGQVWLPTAKPGTGDYYRSSWKCPNKCTLKDLESEHYREVIKSES